MKFSVLMSIYIKEQPEYVKTCFDSLLHQTVKADEWVVVEDGPLTTEMYELLDEYQKMYPGLIRRLPLEKNQGLGKALRAGVVYCKNELIARMDTDDIARKDRFEKQIKEFEQNPKLDICGSHIIEFEGKIENEIARRNVPLEHSEIARYQKQRSAFNHMTVMYKKSAVINAGNYEHCPLMEDDMLWIRMLITGAICKNIDDYLVYARTGQAMIERRGGFAYLKKYISARNKILDTGYISRWDYTKTVLVQCVVALIPKKMRLFIFKTLLR
ncbi:MAG: glycosyltransferase [Lachnospiraceae bacterium]|jgi:glycosyltransferase involved in cell wall biosynthesis